MRRYPLLLLGHLAFALGLAGIFIPGLPTVVFWLVAAWAYGKSCPHLQERVLNNPRYGTVIRAWRDHHVVPSKAKVAAGTTMLLSLVVLSLTADSWTWPAFAAACMVPVFVFIVTRPSTAPTGAPAPVSE